MKSLTLVVTIFAVSLAVVNCQFGFGFRPFVRPFGFGGFGFRPFARPFGFGGFGFNRFRGGFGGFNRFGFGKRELDFNSTVSLLDADDIRVLNETNSNMCFYSSRAPVINCFSHNETFNCPVVERFVGLKNITVKLTNLELVPVESKTALRLVEKSANFTFVLPQVNKEVNVSLKNVDDFTEPGLLVEDQDCWSTISGFVNRFQKIDFRMNLAL
ncbi:unnamed protein product [Brachionus calyciflorus]|uniref:Uncharacterized protein n=1 Tax=Brachionus calyciflorus TaxID=104777 RepID=A0A813MK13_9BILA|nr:unnamed protein product [Brachionus calyciflorus]